MPVDRVTTQFSPSPVVGKSNNGDHSFVSEVSTTARSRIASYILGEPTPVIVEPEDDMYGLFAGFDSVDYWNRSSRFPSSVHYQAHRNDRGSTQDNVQISGASTHGDAQQSAPRTYSTRYLHDPNQYIYPPRRWDGTIDAPRMTMGAAVSHEAGIAQQPSMSRHMRALPTPTGVARYPSILRAMVRETLPRPAEVAQEREERKTEAEEETEEENDDVVADDGVDDMERPNNPDMYNSSHGPLRDDRIIMPAVEFYANPMWPDAEIRGRRERERRQRERYLASQQGSEACSAPASKKRRRSS